jgi:outer membrane lipoprotein-sorting protein
MYRRTNRLARAALCAVAFAVTAGSSHGQTEPEPWLTTCEAAYAGVTNYTATFHKQQRVAGKLLPEETVSVKFRRPFSLYMKWTGSPFKGSELLYVEGWNNNQARVHRGGLLRFITFNLAPTSPRLMSGNLRPLTDTGLGYLVKTVAANVRRAKAAGELTLYDRGQETVRGRKMRRLEAVFPKDKEKGYSAYRLIVGQDLESGLLVTIQAYDWDDRLFEKYGYEDIKLEAGLTDQDFDPHNSKYQF